MRTFEASKQGYPGEAHDCQPWDEGNGKHKDCHSAMQRSLRNKSYAHESNGTCNQYEHSEDKRNDDHWRLASLYFPARICLPVVNHLDKLVRCLHIIPLFDEVQRMCAYRGG